MRLSTVPSLCTVFATAFWAGTDVAFAQEPDFETLSGHSISVVNDNAPQAAYSFKPELCDTIEQDTSDEVKAIALDDELFSAIHEWKDQDDAKDIFLYRMCQEDDISQNHGTVFDDVLWRVYKQDWYLEVLKPFFEKDPAFLRRAEYTGYLRNRETRESRLVVEYSWSPLDYELEEDQIKITYSEDMYKAMAADSDRAENIFRYFDDLRSMPDIESVLAVAVKQYPLSVIRYTHVLAEYPDLMTDIDIGSYLLIEAQNMDSSRLFMSNFDDYAHLPEAQQIIQTVIDNDPLSFFETNEREGVSSILEEDGFVTLPLAKLRELAADKKRASDLVRYYQFYSHLPEARDIAQAAIFSDTMSFLKVKNDGKLHPLLAGDRTLEISGQSILSDARDNDHGRGYKSPFYEYYNDYAHLPEAEEIVRTTIILDPQRYYRAKLEGDLPAAFSNPDFAPTIEDLRVHFEREISKDERRIDARSLIVLLKYYDQYSHLDGSTQFVQDLMNFDPEKYLEMIDYRDERYDDVLDSGMTPSKERLIEAAQDVYGAEDIVRGFQYYQTLDGALEVLQEAIKNSPLSFLKRKMTSQDGGEYYEYFAPIQNLLDDGVIQGPTIDDISEYMQNTARRLNFGDLIDIYPEIQNDPLAWSLMTAAIDENIGRSLYSIDSDIAGARFSNRYDHDFLGSERGNNKSIHWPLPDAAHKREILSRMFAYIALEHPEEFIKNFEGNTYGFQKPLALAMESEQSAVFDLVIEQFRTNPVGVMNLLSDKRNRAYIDGLDDGLKTTLVDISKAAIDTYCRESDDVVAGRKDIRDYERVDSMQRMLEEGSWVTEGGYYSKEEIGPVIGCYLASYPEGAIKTLEENKNLTSNLGMDYSEFQDIIVAGVNANPLYFLDLATQHEETSDLNILGTTVPYEDILDAAKIQFSEALADKRRGYSEFRRATRILNNLHNYPDNIRFALLDDMPEGHYIDLVTQDDSDFYTSTFNYIMSGFLRELESHPESREKLWVENHYGDSTIQKVLENAMQFGRIDEFLALLDDSEKRLTTNSVLDRLTASGDSGGSLRRGNNSVLMAATTELLTNIADQGDSGDIETILVERFTNERISESRTTLGLAAALYSDRAEIKTHIPFFAEVQNIYLPHMERYMRTDMQADDLFDDQGRNFQMMVFYDDKDGHASFWHFKEAYNKDRRWKYDDHGTFISYSRNGIDLFANKPQFEQEGNQAIRDHIEEQDGTLSVLIHRGHSYHVRKTAKNYLNEDVQFFWLGSCRSSVIWDYIDDAPNMQFIYSSNVGSMRVNDPLLKNINDTLAASKDVNWVQMREDAARISNNSKYVESYVFPDGSMEYALRMVQSLFNGDKALARETQRGILDAIYQNATGEPLDRIFGANLLETVDNAPSANDNGLVRSPRPLARPIRSPEI